MEVSSTSGLSWLISMSAGNCSGVRSTSSKVGKSLRRARMMKICPLLARLKKCLIFAYCVTLFKIAASREDPDSATAASSPPFGAGGPGGPGDRPDHQMDFGPGPRAHISL
eukprot:9436683-Pyramimonas_sp.AAC.2